MLLFYLSVLIIELWSCLYFTSHRIKIFHSGYKGSIHDFNFLFQRRFDKRDAASLLVYVFFQILKVILVLISKSNAQVIPVVLIVR